MNATYLCTLGISIANHLDENMRRERLKKNLPWDASDPEFEKALAQYAVGIPVSGEERDLCCAEATILAKMKVARGDRVRLLATDTCLGRICGENVRSLLSRCFGLDSGDVSVVRVEGLQMGDAQRLRESGIKNLLDAVNRFVETERHSGFDVCLCPNGGYKGIVPFLTLAGMVLHCKVVYTFEHVRSLVVLPPLPFALDADAYLRARDAIAALYDEIEMPENRFLSMVSGLQPDERDRFLGFTEPSGKPGFVTLSPLVEIATAGAEVQSAWLSPQAVKDLEKLGDSIAAENCRRLALASQDPLYRRSHLERKHSTDLEAVYIHNTAERVMGYGYEGRFLICRIFADHDEYERFLNKPHAKRAVFPSETFVETSLRKPSGPVAESDDIESWADLKADRDRLALSVATLQNDLERLRNDLTVAREREKTLATAERELKSRCENSEKRLAQLTRDLKRARSDVAKAHLARDNALQKLSEEKARAGELDSKRHSPDA